MQGGLQTNDDGQPPHPRDTIGMKTLNQLRWTYLTALFILLGCTLALGAFTLHLAYREALARGLNDTATHARIAENSLTQSLSRVELSIDNAMTDLASDADEGGWQNTLNRTLRDVPMLRSLSVLGEDGRIVTSTNPRNVGLTVLTERFLPAGNVPTERLRLGPAWTGQDFNQGQPVHDAIPTDKTSGGFIPILRTAQKGVRTLTLLAALDIHDVVNHWVERHAADNKNLSVLLSDGGLLFAPAAGELADAPPRKWVTDLNLALKPSGMLEQQLNNGAQVLIGFQSSSQFPLLVLAQHSRANALASWQRNTTRMAVIVGSALLLVIAIGAILYRRQRELMVSRADSFYQLALNAKVFDASMEAILICDADNHILSVNPAFLRITGYSASEVRGRNPRFMGSGLHDLFFYETMWRQLLNTDHWQGELVNRHADSSLYNVRMTLTVNRNDQGQVRHLIGSLVDVTAEKEMEKALRQSEEQYRSLFDHMQHGFALHDIITDEDGKPSNYRLVAANKAYAEMTGFGSQQIVGRLVTELFPAVLQDKVDWIGLYGGGGAAWQAAPNGELQRRFKQVV